MRQTTTQTSGADRLDREILVLGAVVVLGTIMPILDVTIVNVAVPTLGSDFHASISTIQWVMTGYMLAFASVIPLTGWATERFGAKRVWLVSLLLFMFGSVLAGAAWSVGALIAFRVLQGLGGAIVDQVSWRWIFFVNLPVGVAAVLFAQRLLPDAKPRIGERLDLRGLALLSPGIAIFLYGISEAGSEGGFGSARTIAAAAVGVALVALFVWHARARGKAALIDVSLFLRRGFATAVGVNFLLGLALFGSLILLPLYYQIVRHESPLATGLLLVPQGLGAALAMPLAGRLTDAIGARVVVPVGRTLAGLGTLAFTQVGANTSYAYLAPALLVVGFGLGSTIMPSMAVAFQTLSREETPRAASALNAIQRLAGAIGTTLLAIMLQRAIAANVPTLDGGIQGMATLSPQQRAHVTPAIADAFGTTFWVAVVLIAAALVPALLLPRRVRAQSESAPAGAATASSP